MFPVWKSLQHHAGESRVWEEWRRVQPAVPLPDVLQKRLRLRWKWDLWDRCRGRHGYVWKIFALALLRFFFHLNKPYDTFFDPRSSSVLHVWCLLLFFSICPSDCIEYSPKHHPSPEDIMSHFTLHFKRFVCNLFVFLVLCVCVWEVSFLTIPPPLSSRLVSVTVTFILKAINLQTVRHRELPDCYDFTIIVCDTSAKSNFFFSQVWHRTHTRPLHTRLMWQLNC